MYDHPSGKVELAKMPRPNRNNEGMITNGNKTEISQRSLRRYRCSEVSIPTLCWTEIRSVIPSAASVTMRIQTAVERLARGIDAHAAPDIAMIHIASVMGAPANDANGHRCRPKPSRCSAA